MEITKVATGPTTPDAEEHVVLAVPNEETTGVTHDGKWYQAILGVVRVPLHMVEELVNKHKFTKPAEATSATLVTPANTVPSTADANAAPT